MVMRYYADLATDFADGLVPPTFENSQICMDELGQQMSEAQIDARNREKTASVDSSANDRMLAKAFESANPEVVKLARMVSDLAEKVAAIDSSKQAKQVSDLAEKVEEIYKSLCQKTAPTVCPEEYLKLNKLVSDNADTQACVLNEVRQLSRLGDNLLAICLLMAAKVDSTATPETSLLTQVQALING
jgi:hypothetical protein